VSFGSLYGASQAMRKMYDALQRIARTDATVLIEGESGTGKELITAEIVRRSHRSGKPFVVVDCGSIAPNIVESELFGHARGSFTGATGARRGLFEEAAGGTLFLDEIGDIGGRIQGQLLRVLQEGEIRRVGESMPVKVDTRVVAATNKDLAEAVKAGKFREDLYYRLNVVSILIPPLRDRREDIPLLAEHFAARHAGARGATITTQAREALVAYHWPGNVRELENAVARALALNPGGTILPEDLPDAMREGYRPGVKPAAPAPALTAAAGADPLLADRPTLDELTRRYAERVLREQGGNKTRAAELLGIDRKTLSRLLREE
jgi:DNA-binding NtrC family response regulator